MMIFLDTSSLIKLYFEEEGTSHIDELFIQNIINEIFLSEISITEFYSAIYKKLRSGDIEFTNLTDILSAFTADKEKFTFVAVGSDVVEASKKLIEKYGTDGLRALDAIQLATATYLKSKIALAVSNDKLLNSFLLLEGIKIL